MTKADDELKRAIDAELAADSKVNAALIGVSVGKGAVSLVGTVDTHAEKRAAEAAAGRVSGVRTVTTHVTVKGQDDTTVPFEASMTEAEVADQTGSMNG